MGLSELVDGAVGIGKAMGVTLSYLWTKPVTVETGTSTLIGSDPDKLRYHLIEVLDGTYKQGSCPDLWDGRAAERIAELLARDAC